MKKIIFTIAAVLATVSAQAQVAPEKVGSSDCGFVRASDASSVYTYLTNDKGQVKIDVLVQESTDSEGRSTEFRTDIISSLVVSGEEIVHQETGVVCAKFKKPGPIGKRTWVGSRKCQIKTSESSKDVFDQDGFKVGRSCVRDYFFVVKVK